MIIAFCGPSDSGKTSVIREVKNLPYFTGRQVIVKKEYSFRTVEALKKLGGSTLISEYHNKVFFRKPSVTLRSRIVSFGVRTLFPLLAWGELLVDHILYEVVWKEKILLCDRYIYDHDISFRHILGAGTALSSFLYRRFPMPSLLFFLRISVPTSLVRNKNDVRGKITSERWFHEKVIREYNALADQLDAIVIDNNGKLDQAVRNIVRNVLARDTLMRAKEIAIIGMDGTGKTTLVESLCRYARKLHMPCTVVHFYHNALLYRLLLAFGFFRQTGSQKERYAKSRARARVTLKKGKSFLWALLHVADAYLQYVLARVLYRNHLVVYDRFFPDYIVSFQMLNIRKRSVFTHRLPRCHHTILLTCDPSVSHRRKPENTKAFFVESTKVYHALAVTYQIAAIDTTHKRPAQLVKEVIRTLSV